MNVPPAILDLRIASPERNRPLHLWLPIFLLWPLLLAIGVVSVVLTLIADAVLLVLGQPYHRYTMLVIRSLLALGDTRGMVIRITNDETAVDMTVQ
jgi:hypothetical protein